MNPKKLCNARQCIVLAEVSFRYPNEESTHEKSDAAYDAASVCSKEGRCPFGIPPSISHESCDEKARDSREDKPPLDDYEDSPDGVRKSKFSKHCLTPLLLVLIYINIHS